MKRWFESRSKSADTLVIHREDPAPTFEPRAKKQKPTSTIKQNVKRLFRSVRRILPGSQSKKTQPLGEEGVITFGESIQKTVAVQEAQAFLERVGPDCLPETLYQRIDYLWKLVNDSFERAYQACLKGKGIVTTNATANDYLTEIRSLQKILRERPIAIAPVMSPPTNAIDHLDCTAIEPLKRSQSSGNLSQQPITSNQQATQQHAPQVPPRPITEGIIFNGVENDVFLSRYNLSSDIAEPQKDIEDQLSPLQVQPVQTEVFSSEESQTFSLISLGDLFDEPDSSDTFGRPIPRSISSQSVKLLAAALENHSGSISRQQSREALNSAIESENSVVRDLVTKFETVMTIAKP